MMEEHMLDRRALFTALAALPLAGCATLSPAQPRRLKVVTFNIWHDRENWPARLPLILEALRQADADVIALQEVLQDGERLPNQARTIAEALGYGWTFCSTDAADQPRRYGNAVLTRLPILQQQWKALEPLDDYRTALRVRIDVQGRPVDIVATHLHHTPEGTAIRERQVADLLTWLPSDGTPRIVLGDLNAAITNPELAGLRPQGVVSALPAVHPERANETTLNVAMGHRSDQIDHILVDTDRFTLESAQIFANQAVRGIWPSDHFAVAATVTLR